MRGHQILTLNSQLSDTWHNKANVWTHAPNQTFPNEDRFHAFTSAKDVLQDTGEALMVHREKSFDANPLSGYLEFYGVMQAIFIQQDALLEMNFALTGEIPQSALIRLRSQCSALFDLRYMRNWTAGHPTRKARGEPHVVRASIPRQSMSYDQIEVLFLEPSGKGTRRQTAINLGEMINEFNHEASTVFANLVPLLSTQIDDYTTANPSVI